jgi:CRP/FNR family cyclic AMP-dependent transcriptional regulator
VLFARCLGGQTGAVEFPFLAGTDEDLRRGVLRATRSRRFRRNEVLFHAGDPANGLHLLVSGHISIATTTPMGDIAILAVLGPGATFGEMSLLTDGLERSATATALDPVETRVLVRDDFARLRRTYPQVDRFLVDLLAGYVRRQDSRLLEALYLPVEKRVLRRLLELADIYGGRASGAPIPLTQEIVAEMSGTTRPTANHILRSAEAAGLIVVERGRLRVTDADGLARRAGLPLRP